MANISTSSIVICSFLFVFFLIELVSLIRSVNKKKGKKVFVHLIGVAATALISYSVIKVALGVELSSSIFIIAALAISSIFFIICGFDSLFVVKR